MRRSIYTAVAVALSLTSCAGAQAELKGTDFAVQSDGTFDGELDRNGYIGTFIHVAQEGDVALTAHLTGTTTDATRPTMTLTVANDSIHANVGDAETTLRLKTHLPAGAYFVRIQLDNSALPHIRSLTVTALDIHGATFDNQNTDANALAAADAYIEHFRQGDAVIHVAGVPAGTLVHFKLKRHVFNFGAAVSGYETSMHMDANPPAGSDAAHYQQVLKDTFNLLVPGNAGKWIYNEKVRGTPTMGYIDQLRDFAKTNDLRMRMHTLLWDTDQQPPFVRDLIAKASAGDAAAKADLRKAISDRIQYYVKNRAASYVEMDVLNEAYHQPRYWAIFGADGIADIFREVADAAKSAGAATRLCVNEYNILQWSQTPPYGKGASGGTDLFANWYREHVEQIRDAGGPVSGIGVQYYADVRTDIPQLHAAARINQVFQNLSVTGLPISLTEFGVNALPKRPTPPTSQQNDAAIESSGKVIDETMRMAFGTPAVTTFICWGFWGGDVWEQAPLGTLYDKQWNLTPAGKAYFALRTKWTTDVTLTVGEDGTVKLHGFFGEYDVTANGKSTSLLLERGQTSGQVAFK